jgi:hypothetical protein
MPLARNSDACFCILCCHPIGSSSPTNMLMHILEMARMCSGVSFHKSPGNAVIERKYSGFSDTT